MNTKHTPGPWIKNPELLQVLTQCADYFAAIDAMQPDKDHGLVGKAVREAVRNAIAKATGEKP